MFPKKHVYKGESNIFIAQSFCSATSKLLLQLVNDQSGGADLNIIIAGNFGKDRTMYITNKILIKTVCPIIALLFFFATITPAIVQAQANEKRENAESLWMLKLAQTCKNGLAMVSQEERLAIKAKVLTRAGNLFDQIAQSGFSEETLQKYGSMLPRGFAEKIMLVSDIAKTGMPTEEKLQVIQGAFGYSCNDIIYAGVVVYVFNFFGVIPYLGYFGGLLFASAVLCYLGVF